MSTVLAPKVGDKVSVNHPKYPGIWTVKSLGPVNVVLFPEGGGIRLRVPRELLLDPTDAPVVTEVPVETAAYFAPGEIVRIPSGKYAGLYVVLADKGAKVNVALLGGDGGRYVRALRPSLVRVDAAEVLK